MIKRFCAAWRAFTAPAAPSIVLDGGSRITDDAVTVSRLHLDGEHVVFTGTLSTGV